MNWDFIWWFMGIVLTVYAIKFLLSLCKSLLGKEAREDLIDSMGNSISNANKRITKNLKKKAAERKQQKTIKKEEEHRAIVRVL